MAALGYALKSISRRKLKNLSLVLAISIGVTMLVAAQIANDGIVNVFSKTSLDGYGKTDITISNPVNSIGLFPENITDVIEEQQNLVNEKINYISPSLRYLLPVYDPTEGQYERSVFINGIYPDIDGYRPFYDTQDHVIDLPEVLNDNQSVLISSSLAERFEMDTGDPLLISVPNGLGNFSQFQIQVTDIYDDNKGRGIEGVFPPSTTEFQIYLHIETLQQQFHSVFKDFVNTIDISLKDELVDRRVEEFDPIKDEFPGMEEIKTVIEHIQPKVNEVLPTASVRSPRIELLTLLDDQLERFTITNNTFIILINLTALLLIINVQTMSIDDRKNQTAVLRALGNSKRTIIKIFLYETIILGLLGSILAIFLGIEMGKWIQDTINSIFGLSGISPVLKPQTMIVAIILGVSLASLTAILPTLRVINQPISNALRGIEEDDESVSVSPTKLSLSLITISVIGLVSMGEFWTREIWRSFTNQLIISISLVVLLTGFFLLTAHYIHRRSSLTLWGLSFIVIAAFNRNISFYLVSNPDLTNIVNWFLAMMFFTLIGTIVIVAVNFDLLMKLLEKIMFFFKGSRATIQVSVSQLIDKRARMILIFSILTIIMVISLFFSSLAVSERQGLINQFEWRSQGVNIVVDVQAPTPGIEEALENIDGVIEVFPFKKSRLTVYTDDPSSEYFNPQEDIVYSKSIVEVPEEVLKPNGNWDDNSLALSVFGVDDNLDYHYDTDLTPSEVTSLSQEIFDDFFAKKSINKPVLHTENGTTIDSGDRSSRIVLGGFQTAFYNDLIDRTIYLQGSNQTIPVAVAAGMVDMMGDATGFGNVILVPPDIASSISSLSELSQPNLFLVRTTPSYFDDTQNREIGRQIENTLNNLNPQDNPICSTEFCPLVGASTRLVHEEIKQIFELDSQTWEFFALFSFFALVIGVLGMVIIAIRSVGERTREIGMQRAIGFTKKSVITSLALELLVVVMLGIIIGVINSVINVDFFARNVYRTNPVYPLPSIALNIGMVFVASLFAGIIPAYRASKIPPSEALRYTG